MIKDAIANLCPVAGATVCAVSLRHRFHGEQLLLDDHDLEYRQIAC
jgi:hypothetical protein